MKPRSLTSETLLRVAVGVIFIVALSSGITYWLIYNQLEHGRWSDFRNIRNNALNCTRRDSRWAKLSTK
jgi:hypothetical protein